VKWMAVLDDVWDVIDPSGNGEDGVRQNPLLKYERQPSLLMEPLYPEPEHVNEEKTKVSQLSKGEKEDYKFLQELFHIEHQEYMRRMKKLGAIQLLIYETVDLIYYEWLYDGENVRDKLISLQERVKPLTF
jgi:hypothetical protein